MKKYLFLLVLCCVSFLSAEIIQTDNIEQIEKELSKAITKKSLVVFDLDEVIFSPKDQIFRQKHRAEYKKLAQDLKARISKEKEPSLYMAISDAAMNRSLVDLKFPKLLNKLGQEKIKAIALTSCPSGYVDGKGSIEDMRINELKRFDIDFAKLFGSEEYKTFKIVKSQFGKIVLKKGIIFTAGIEKGFALSYVLYSLKEFPQRIVFIDDQRQNLESVETFCQDMKIDFLGFEYTACRDLDIKPLNLERASFQFKYLEKQGKWLADNDAEQKMKKRDRAL